MQTLDVNGLRMQVAVQGSGPLVLLCHGFPELWISWRAQLDALAAAGYRAVAPDMRGYGGTYAPDDATAYTQLHLVGDMVELVRALKETQAVIVGHDWGAPVAWNAALLRPDVFRAVVGMSVPFAPPGRVEMLSALSQAGIHDFYLQYFQAPGVAEAELERDVGASIRRIHFGASGEGQALLGRPVFGAVEPDKGFLGHLVEPPSLPEWWNESDMGLLHRRVHSHGLSRRAELVSQHQAVVGAVGAVARSGHPPAVDVHCRRQRRRAEVPRLQAADRELQQDPAWLARLPHPGGRRALDPARACARSQLALDRVHQ